MAKQASKAELWAKRIAYLGLIPFIVFVLGLWITNNPEAKGQLAVLFLYYSVVILSFMAGTLWGALIPLVDRTPQAIMTMVLIIGIVISAWCALLLDLVTAAAILFIGYALVLAYERRLAVGEQFPDWYHNSRKKLTFIVLGLHVLYGFGLFR